MNQWLSEFKRSWHDKNFICAIAVFTTSYALIAAVTLLLPAQIFITILSGIAGWQIASWSFRIAPKLKQLLFKD
jgi:hypothetical protein